MRKIFYLSLWAVIFLTISLSYAASSKHCELPEFNKPVKMVALVLARGGSKGIKLKNLVKLNEVSLLANTLTIIHKSKVFNEVWVSTDHHLIAEDAERYNASVHWRPESVSSDETSSIDSVREFLGYHPFEILALVQCTSVFLKESYLQDAFAEMAAQQVECVFSVCVSHKLRWRETRADGSVSAINFNPFARPRRQDWSGELVENGMFYFATRKLLQRGAFQSKRCKTVKVPVEDSLEIDSISDLKLARILSLF